VEFGGEEHMLSNWIVRIQIHPATNKLRISASSSLPWWASFHTCKVGAMLHLLAVRIEHHNLCVVLMRIGVYFRSFSLALPFRQR
jgi:hypothetical protein